MTYKEALLYLESFVNYEKKDKYDYGKSLKLERMKRIAALLGNPQDSVKSIHIAGTKGKGSTSAITQSILKEAGYRTGLYTSPHLISFRERIKIDDSMISEEDIGIFAGRLKDALKDLSGEEPSFFEAYTALAYLYFSQKKADFAVYETGLGGRLDATNIISPLVTVITPISYEHMDKLGYTLTEITSEKCGIIKEGIVCISAPQEEEAMARIQRICSEKRSRLVRVGKDIKFKIIQRSCEGQSFEVEGICGKYTDLETGLLGDHQAVNAAAAVGAVESLRLSGITVPEEAIRRGVLNCRWPGRLDVVSKRPFVILDGAQNRASARALADAIKKLFVYRKLILVVGISKDKDIKGMLDELLPISQSVVVTKSRVASRACEPSVIAALAGPRSESFILTSGVEDSITRARELAQEDDLILVTGSLFVVGEAMEILTGIGQRAYA